MSSIRGDKLVRPLTTAHVHSYPPATPTSDPSGMAHTSSYPIVSSADTVNAADLGCCGTLQLDEEDPIAATMQRSMEHPRELPSSINKVHIQMVALPEKFADMISKHARFEEIRRISRRSRSSRSSSPSSIDRANRPLSRANSAHERVDADIGSCFHDELNVGVSSLESHDGVGSKRIDDLGDKFKAMRTSAV